MRTPNMRSSDVRSSESAKDFASPEPQPGDVPPALGFFQRPAVQNVLPFITSMAAHAVIVILALTLLAVTEVIQLPTFAHQEQTTIPEAATAENPDSAGGVPNLGHLADPTRAMMQDHSTENTRPDGTSTKAGPSVEPSSEGGGSGDDNPVRDLVAGGTRTGGPGNRFGPGGGPGDGGGDNADGQLAQFGLPGGGAGFGPKNPVFGTTAGARRIVYVCDATGTMINKLSGLKAELEKAIGNLKAWQSFNVVFYTDGGKVLLADKNGLMLANNDNKRAAFKWLADVTATGTTDPIPAIESAFRLHPTADLVYFLSDGEFNNLRSYDEVAAAVAKGRSANPRCKVNTILFETYDRQAEETMERVAKENRGVYRYVMESDLR